MVARCWPLLWLSPVSATHPSGAPQERTMYSFDHILNWKLEAGSHHFPSETGGTCVNEAAVVALGFEYRRIADVEDMPVCFSRPICRLAMRLNDMATDDERQRLLPYVMR